MAILSNLLGGGFSYPLKSHTAVRRAVCGISSLRRLQNSGGSMRCYSNSSSSSSSPKPSPLDPLFSEMRSLHKDVNPSVVALRSIFSAPGGGHCSRAGAGVFVDRGLIVTSAHVVGKLSGSDVQSCSIGSTFAITIANQILKMKAVAVDFTGDVAVLETEGDLLPPPCVVASSIANKELPLMVITKDEGCNGGGILQMKVKFVEDISTNRIDWPYEVKDGFGWARYGGAPIDEVKVVPGSPWFSSIGRQVVGTASWAVGEEVVGSVGGFVAPPLRIKYVVDYAKRKGPSDPVVLDRWINAVTFADYDVDDADHVKECLKKLQSGYVISTYLDYELLA